MAMLENEFSAAVLEGASMGAKDVDANLIVFPVGLIDGAYSDKVGNVFRYQYNVLNAFLKSESIDGAVIEYGTIVSTVPEETKQRFLSLIGDVPVILLAESAEGYPSICVDNKVGLEEVINHLIKDHGCKKIGFVSGPANNHDAQERLNVYKDTLNKYNLSLGDDWISYGNFSVYSEEAVTSLVERHPDIEAIVFANDHMALGAYPVLEKLGRKPGKDIFITGFDNIPSSMLADPPLTTVVADTKQLAYKAVIEISKDKELQPQMFVDTHMVCRRSCGCSKEDIYSRQKEGNESEANVLENITREKIIEGERRKDFEIELGNILREMVFYQDSRLEWYSSVLDVMKKLDFGSVYWLHYDRIIYHRNGTVWNQPDNAHIVGYYNDVEKKIFDGDEFVVDVDNIFNHKMLQKDRRLEMVVTPLFFRENQYGFMMVESEYKYFQFAFQIASQISSTLEFMRVMENNEKTKRDMEKVNRRQIRFLANMTSEIRTPVNAILGMDEMILRENDVPDIDEYAADIKSAATTVLNITNDILDFSKLESNRLTILYEEYSVYELISSVVDYMMPKAKQKGLYLNLNFDEYLPSMLIGDEKRLRQVLSNLLSNAVKYTECGGVELKVVGKQEGNKEFITFSVCDTGIGIEKDNLERLYRHSEKSGENRFSHVDGLGLGLSIATGILALMGSELKVESEYNEGSVFSFTVCQTIYDNSPISALSFDEEMEVKEKYEQAYTAPDAHILVVDDNELNRAIIKNLLKWSKINICEAASGRECLEMVKKQNFDLILMDDKMPELSGHETLNLLKKMPEYNNYKAPVVVVSGKVLYGAVTADVKGDFDDCLAKPVNPQELDEIVIKYLPEIKLIYEEKYEGLKDLKEMLEARKRAARRNRLLSMDSEEVRKELIMIVDDDPIALRIEQQIFADAYDTICFSSGIKCLEYLNGKKAYPDIIIADVALKDVTGFRLLSQVLGNPEIEDIPVVLTDHDNNRDIEVRCFEEGASDFFIKPLVPEIVKKRVRKLLDLRHLQKYLKDEVELQTRASEDGRKKVERLSHQSMTAMAAAIDAKDKYTNGHSIRVAKYSNMIALKSGKSARDIMDIYYIGLLHDVGKIGVPDEIINKPTRLTDEEFAIIKTHPVIGADILKNIDELPNIVLGAHWHHERYDGKGYPDGLKGQDIPEIARIIGVADAYDAMTSIRSYRGIMSQETVRAEIEKGKGTQFDPFYADIMLQIIDEDKEYKLHE